MVGLQGQALEILAGHVAVMERRIGASLRKELTGDCCWAILAYRGCDRFGMLVEVGTIIVLDQYRITVVEVHHAMSDEVFLIGVVKLLGGNT